MAESAVAVASRELPLLAYRELYELWERQQWRVQDLDFTQDRIDWHEGFEQSRRRMERFALSGFFLGEQRVTRELGPMMRAMPDEDARVFLSTQIADEARHVAFFDRFFAEVGVIRPEDLDGRIDLLESTRGPGFTHWFDELLAERADRLGAAPDDFEALVEAVVIYHLLIEGTIATTSQHSILARFESEGVLPGFVEGFTNVTRDEHRHVAFGVRFLRDAAQNGHADTIRRLVDELGPRVEELLLPPSDEPLPDDMQLLDGTVGERRAAAAKALERRVSVIGI